MIELNDITVQYGTHLILNHFSASIPFNGTTAIFGPSGSGKTTLLRVLVGLIRPDYGRINGLEALKIAVVFQEDRLLPWLTALENIAIVSDQQSAQKYLEQIGLIGAANQCPAALSGGMKRRVALGRALAYGGDLLLLDEPFNGLDEVAKKMVADSILATQLPVIVVTHDHTEAELLRAEQYLTIQ
ncbi:MAG: ATP-binding cassette domain-containing protein [Clostridia bacterium]